MRLAKARKPGKCAAAWRAERERLTPALVVVMSGCRWFPRVSGGVPQFTAMLAA